MIPRLSWILIVLALVRGLVYWAVVPPWQAPDEPQHFQYVRLIVELKRFPTRFDARTAVDLQEEVYQSMRATRFWELRADSPAPYGWRARSAPNVFDVQKLFAAVDHPPLYYALSALVLWPLHNAPTLAQLYVLRLFSVLLSTISVIVAYWSALELLPGRLDVAWGAALFIALLPMHAFMAAAVNNDVLAEALGALTFMTLAILILYGPSLARLSRLTLIVLLALGTKRTTVYLIPLIVIMLAIVLFLPSLWRVCFQCSVVFVAITALILMASLIWTIGPVVGALIGHLTSSSSQVSLVQVVSWFLISFASFWANFGWLNVPLDPGWYVLLAMLTLLAAIGWMHFVRRQVWLSSTPSLFAVVMTLAVSLALLQTVVISWLRSEPAQGRYLFPALVPIALCFTTGWLELIPASYRPTIIQLGTFCGAALDFIGMIGYVLPHFYV